MNIVDLLNLRKEDLRLVSDGGYRIRYVRHKTKRVYDVKVEPSEGYTLHLSDYDNMDDMIDDYMDILKDIVEWKGYQHKWNVGTFEIQKKNIRKWIDKRISTHIENCEKFCKENCEMELCVSARFSNGETWYSKVG